MDFCNIKTLQDTDQLLRIVRMRYNLDFHYNLMTSAEYASPKTKKNRPKNVK